MELTKAELLKLYVCMSNVWDTHCSSPEIQPTLEFVDLMEKIKKALSE